MHLADGAATDPQGDRDVQRVGAHQHDVGCFDGDVGAGADRDPEVCLGQRRGVVHPVADHRDPLAGRHQRFDPRGFVAR